MIPQTTFVLTFRPHIISELGGVYSALAPGKKLRSAVWRTLAAPRRHTTAPLLHRSRAAAAERAQTTLEVPELISTMV